MPTGSVHKLRSCATTRGQRKLFQLARKRMMARLAEAGANRGKAIEMKMRNSDAPSMRAESSNSSGMLMANWRIRKMAKALSMPGTIRPA